MIGLYLERERDGEGGYFQVYMDETRQWKSC